MLTHTIPLNTESLVKSPMAADHQRIGAWTYFTYDLTDEDTGRDLAHFVVHQDTGEERVISWDRYGVISTPNLCRLCEMGWPEQSPDGLKWTERRLDHAYRNYHRPEPAPWFGSRWMLALIAAAAVLVGVML